NRRRGRAGRTGGSRPTEEGKDSKTGTGGRFRGAAGVVLVRSSTTAAEEDVYALPATDRKRRQEPGAAIEGRDGGHRAGSRSLRPGATRDRGDGTRGDAP